jgi:predicted ester cyclase
MKKKTLFLSLIVLNFVFSNCQEPQKTAVKTLETSRLAIAARNKANFIKANAAFNEQKLDDAIKFYAPNYFSHTNKKIINQETEKADWMATHERWEDLKITIEQIVAEDDWVMAKCKATATHTKVVMGVKPTNKKLEAIFWELHHFDKDGLMIEGWNMLDNAALMQQLGLLPTPK